MTNLRDRLKSRLQAKNQPKADFGMEDELADDIDLDADVGLSPDQAKRIAELDNPFRRNDSVRTEDVVVLEHAVKKLPIDATSCWETMLHNANRDIVQKIVKKLLGTPTIFVIAEALKNKKIDDADFDYIIGVLEKENLLNELTRELPKDISVVRSRKLAKVFLKNSISAVNSIEYLNLVPVNAIMLFFTTLDASKVDIVDYNFNRILGLFVPWSRTASKQEIYEIGTTLLCVAKAKGDLGGVDNYVMRPMQRRIQLK